MKLPAFLSILVLSLSLIPQTAETGEHSDPLELLTLSIQEMERQDSLLAGYCYMKTVVVEHLDAKHSVKKTEERLIEVTSVPRGPDIEVVVAVNGNPVKKQRRSDGTAQMTVRSEDLVSQFDWSFDGSGAVNGRPATILRFAPKPGAVYTGSDPDAEKFLRKVRGRVWVDGEETTIARIEFEATEPIKSLGGVLWTVHSFCVKEERKRLPDGVWIDSSGEYFVHATALVVKNIIRRSRMWSHDYVRCSPGTTADSPDVLVPK